MIRNFFSLLLLMLFVQNAIGQVNFQTGAAQQSFPLINFIDSKSGLTFNVGADYSSGNGLMVNSMASSLGVGWILNAGGIITRMQVGQPDDQPAYDNGVLTGPQSSMRYPAGY